MDTRLLPSPTNALFSVLPFLDLSKLKQNCQFHPHSNFFLLTNFCIHPTYIDPLWKYSLVNSKFCRGNVFSKLELPQCVKLTKIVHLAGKAVMYLRIQIGLPTILFQLLCFSQDIISCVILILAHSAKNIIPESAHARLIT